MTEQFDFDSSVRSIIASLTESKQSDLLLQMEDEYSDAEDKFRTLAKRHFNSYPGNLAVLDPNFVRTGDRTYSFKVYDPELDRQAANLYSVEKSQRSKLPMPLLNFAWCDVTIKKDADPDELQHFVMTWVGSVKDLNKALNKMDSVVSVSFEPDTRIMEK